MKIRFKDCLVIGFALFAMFFGAGNLIFPPQLGFLTGGKWDITFLAFSITSICVPILGIFAMGKAGGDIRRFAGKVHPLFADVFGTIIMLGIGPLLALPRTAATTYEIGVLPFSGSISPVVSSVVFFCYCVDFYYKAVKSNQYCRKVFDAGSYSCACSYYHSCDYVSAWPAQKSSAAEFLFKGIS